MVVTDSTSLCQLDGLETYPRTRIGRQEFNNLGLDVHIPVSILDTSLWDDATITITNNYLHFRIYIYIYIYIYIERSTVVNK